MSDCDCTGRLDKQAAAIKDLRSRVADLEAALDIATADDPPKGDRSIPDSVIPAPGRFVPRPECMGCGNVKHPSRYKYLTCKACGVERQDKIKSGSLSIVQACMNCGSRKSGTAMLCHPCGKAFKVWKAGL